MCRLCRRLRDEYAVYLTIAQIMEQLEKEYGISTSRGTVGDDIKALQELGVEIEVVPSTQKRFSLIGRRFDLPELKTLIDAVESARFIPKEKSAALVEKLGSLTSQHRTLRVPCQRRRNSGRKSHVRLLQQEYCL